MKSVLFLRDFRQFTGGHLKVWHYFNHMLAAEGFAPRIWFSDETVWDASNPWFQMDSGLRVTDCCIEQADILFLAGLDWLQLSPEQRDRPGRPVINFIQHVRHADPKDPLSQFLKHDAIRICVSQEVADAILATGRVRGPVHTISNGLNLESMPAPKDWNERGTDLLILASKRTRLGRFCALLLWRPWRKLRLITESVPKAELMAWLADSRRVLLLPHETEGFYLPALEAMATGAQVICPDCVGNRSFCFDGQNCLRPGYKLGELLAAVRRGQRMDEPGLDALLEAGQRTAREHSLFRERKKFHQLLAHCEALQSLPK
ncbi:MAG: glycosyltransferase family 4 protein [bacterium]|nr:glycosyltransferase family 4 protein [bacterium]